jgi:hypothetical protein
VVPIDSGDVAKAVDRSQEWGISYWDALILTSAIAAGCDRLLSEDLADGASYGGVCVENPFREGRRVSEEATEVYLGAAGRGPWTDSDLRAALARYEQECSDAGMKPNAVHSYWDYARRFLEWRTGDYHPRGTQGDGRPVPSTSVNVIQLVEQARNYARAIEDARREQATIDTYHRHAMFFVRWLAGDFQPGRRLNRTARL